MNKIVNTIIVDDEKYSLENLAITIETDFPEINIIGKAYSFDEAISMINELKPDLIFLDIIIKDRTGFEVLDSINNHDAGVIIVSGHNNYGIEAFNHDVVDYLLKPVDTEDLRKAIEKYQKYFRSEETSSLITNQITEKILIHTVNGFHILEIDKIVKLVADINYTNIHLTDGKVLFVSKTLKEFEKILVEKNFVRLHRSHLVNLKYVKEYNSNNNTKNIILTDGSKLEISKNKLKDVIGYIEQTHKYKI